MANTVIVTRTGVEKRGNLFDITNNVVINDGVSDIMDFEVSTRYNPNAGDFSAFQNSLDAQIKAAWDEFEANQGVFDDAGLDTAVQTVQTSATTYTNKPKLG